MKKNYKITLKQSQMLREAEAKGTFNIDDQGKDNISDGETKATPGVKFTDKALKASKKVNDDSNKETSKVMGKLDKEATSDIEGTHVDQTYGTQENTEANSGNKTSVDLRYDEEPSERFKERAEKALVGDSDMGNTQMEDQETKTGEDILNAAIEKNKINKNQRASVQFGDVNIPTPEYDGKTIGSNKKLGVKEDKENKRTMKRLKFKRPFDGMENAIGLIPEGYKSDGKLFEMTDGNESYRVRWEGNLNEGEAIVLQAENKKGVNEEVSKMLNLMEFKAEDTTGILRGNQRLDENKEFTDMFDIVKGKTLIERKDNE